MQAFALGVGGAWLVLLAELCIAFGLRGQRLTSVWELMIGLGSLGPVWLSGAGLIGGIGGIFAERLRTSRSAATELGLLLALVGAAFGWGVGGGRHLSDPALRAGFAALCALGFGAAGTFGARLARRLRVERGEEGAGAPLIVGIFAGVAALIIANHTVLVRLYPAFHGTLSGLSLLGGGLGLALLIPRAKRALPWILGVFGLAWAGLFPGSKSARTLDNFRVVALEGSPTLSLGVQLASRLAPPLPIDEAALARPLGARVVRTDGVDLRGKSFLLITIDALRADHVGAYGAERDVTPEIDALARDGHTFEFAYAATPHTSYSLTSLMTGKYMRPLLLQGAGADSELLPTLLQGYGYRTAAFYPPAVFFVDSERFQAFSEARLGFEYAWIEFAEGEKRVGQVASYLEKQPQDRPLFLWVHLFGPHEPYMKGSRDLGDRDVDRYDSEIFEADKTVGALVRLVRARDPGTVVIISADHGEEFGEHGGRYHGTTVYEEQVRVPMIWNGAGILSGRSDVPVQTVDVVPTLLSSLRIPVPPRVRGNDLTPWLSASEEKKPLPLGFAVAETDSMTLLAEGSERLICERETGACRLFDLTQDPKQKKDLGLARPERFEDLRRRARAFAATHGAYETRGLREGGRDLPEALVRGLAGDKEVAPEVARLLDDADPLLRRKAAELLFSLGGEAQLSALRLAFSREEEESVRAALALALTRLGEPVALATDVLRSEDLALRRRAALAFALTGDLKGAEVLIEWWREPPSEEESRVLLEVFAKHRVKSAVPALVSRLSDVRLRPQIASTLGTIGDEDARPALLRALRQERYVSTRPVLFDALRRLGAKEELVVPLRMFLGMPDPLEGGVQLASELGLLEHVGGPTKKALATLRSLADSGVRVDVTVAPVSKDEAKEPVRLLVLAQSKGDTPGRVRVERARAAYAAPGDNRYRKRPELHGEGGLEVEIPPSKEPLQIDMGVLPGAKSGQQLSLNVLSMDAQVFALVAVPLREELPLPPPEPVVSGDATAP